MPAIKLQVTLNAPRASCKETKFADSRHSIECHTVAIKMRSGPSLAEARELSAPSSLKTQLWITSLALTLIPTVEPKLQNSLCTQTRETTSG